MIGLKSQSIKSAALLMTLLSISGPCWPIIGIHSMSINNKPAQSQSLQPFRQSQPELSQEPVKATTTITTTTDQPPQTEPVTSTNQPTSVRYHDYRRPVWALAHMVNSIKELDYRLGKGANAIEVDVTFSRDGYPLYTYHGPPCDCWRHCHQQEDFNEYLNYVREITTDLSDPIGKNLSLLFLDLKLDYLDQRGKARAGEELAKSVLNNLFTNTSNSPDQANGHSVTRTSQNDNNNTTNNNISTTTFPFDSNTKNYSSPVNEAIQLPLYLILSVNHVADTELIHNFLHQLELNNASHLMYRIGFDVGMNDDLQQIETMWRRFGPGLNLWQGDGYTNCFSPFYNLERLSKALVKRDNLIGYPAKVYHWTIDLHDRMRESLLMGVDAIMTNHPERLLTVLREPEIAHDYRLATRADYPFKKILRSFKSSESARYQRSTVQTNGGFFGGLADVISSWFTYIREIPFLSLPTTSRLLSRSSSTNRRSQLNAQKRNTAAEVVVGKQSEYQLLVGDSTSSHNNNSNNNASDITKQFATASVMGRTGTSNGHVEDTGTGISISEAVDQTILGTDQKQQTPYEGPKWYTSLVSNMLVSIMKIILPPPPPH